MDIQYKLIKNFGPSVFAAKIPEDIINKLNNYVDQLVEDQKKSRQQNYGENLVGDVTQEIKIDQNTIKETGWLKFLATCTKQWIELETKKKITKDDPLRKDDFLLSIIPKNKRESYDILPIIKSVVDKNSFFELGKFSISKFIF